RWSVAPVQATMRMALPVLGGMHGSWKTTWNTGAFSQPSGPPAAGAAHAPGRTSTVPAVRLTLRTVVDRVVRPVVRCAGPRTKEPTMTTETSTAEAAQAASTALRARQRPLKAAYREDPGSALV